MTDDVLAIAWQIVNYGNLDHGVGAWLLPECGTGGVYQYLRGKCGIVDLHIELEELVMRLTAYTFTDQVYAVAYVIQLINTIYMEDVGLVTGELGVGLNGCCYSL